MNSADHPILGPQFGDVPYRVKFDFLAPTMEPVKGASAPAAPTINPTKTYDAAIEEGVQYDVLLIPAGAFSPSYKSKYAKSRFPFRSIA